MAHYLSADDDRSDLRLSPLRVQDASRLCASYIVTAGFDPLRDEAEAYAVKLAQAGVRTTLRRYDGFVHGFLNLVGASPACRRVWIEIAAAFGAFAREVRPREPRLRWR
jgi:acetyl esterase